MPSVMFQLVISFVAAFWMQRNTTLSTEKSSFFLDIFSHTHSTFSCWRFVTLCGWNMDQFVILSFPSSLPGGSIFGALFGGIGLGVLLEPCDSSDVDDGDDTASDVCIRFSMISDMKSRNDMQELGSSFEKVT